MSRQSAKSLVSPPDRDTAPSPRPQFVDHGERLEQLLQEQEAKKATLSKRREEKLEAMYGLSASALASEPARWYGRGADHTVSFTEQSKKAGDQLGGERVGWEAKSPGACL